MARKKKKSTAKKKKPSGLNPLVYEVIGLAMMGLAVIIIFEFGIVGRGLSSVSRFVLGNWHSAIPLLLIVQALMFMIKRKAGGWKNRIVGGVYSSSQVWYCSVMSTYLKNCMQVVCF